MRLLETRRDALGLKRRRYDDEGERFNTLEIPKAVLRGVGMRSIVARLERWKRGHAARLATRRLHQAIAERKDVKPLAVAHELGICPEHVRKIMQRQKVKK